MISRGINLDVPRYEMVALEKASNFLRAHVKSASAWQDQAMTRRRASAKPP